MKFKQILEKDIPADIYKKGFGVSFPPDISQDLFFVLDQDFKDLGDFIDNKKKTMPQGILDFEAIDNKKYFRLTYNKNKINKNQATNFIKSLFS